MQTVWKSEKKGISIAAPPEKKQKPDGKLRQAE